MKMLTKAVKKILPKLGTTEKVELAEKTVVVKFFCPWSDWTWYAFEGEEIEGDTIFFGMVHGFEKEMGEFSLNELESVRGPLGMKIERDLHFVPCKYSEVA